MLSLHRVLVIAKRSAYDIYVRQHGMQRVLDLLSREDPTVSRLQRSDLHHQRTVDEVHEALEALHVKASFRGRDRVGDLDGFDLVITVGGDGTLLWVSHAVGDTPMLGINSAPEDSVGHLCATQMGSVRAYLESVARGDVARLRLARMQVAVDGVVMQRRVLNDALFANPHPANTTRYLIEGEHGALEEQKSSGVWISTAAGSTAAIRSAGGKALSLRSKLLQYVVREPYMPLGVRYTRLRGVVHPGESFALRNKMREARVYLDGPRLSLPVEMGQRVEFSISDEPLCVLGVSERAMAERPRSSVAPPPPEG